MYLPSGTVRPQVSCVYIRQSTLACVITYIYQRSISESWPKKVELTHMHLIKKCDYCECLHTTTKLVITPTETSLTALVFIS